MLPLPILNVQLQPCHEDWQQMIPTTQGRHCASCQRTVLDFTAPTQADLQAAHAAAPDGRVCGRFRAEQLAPVPRLSPKLRRFLVVLVLVCGLGLTSQEAWAQVRKADQKPKATPQPIGNKMEVPDQIPQDLIGLVGGPPAGAPLNEPKVHVYVEQMPVFLEGGQEGLLKFVEQNTRLPLTDPMLEGRVFVTWILDSNGRVKEAKVLKGIHPAYDAEALRVVGLLNGRFEPGRHNGQAVNVYYTFPVTFRRK